jgi:rhodanese-related sulfurtransferase
LPPEAFVLEVAQPDPMMVGRIDDMLSNIPDGYGGVTAEGLNTELIEDPKLILVDVRRAEELADKGVIDAANPLLPIPIEQFIAEKASWPADTEANIVVYCGSGHRSTIAMSILRSYSYNNVSSLKSGFGGWTEAGYAVVEYAMP